MKRCNRWMVIVGVLATMMAGRVRAGSLDPTDVPGPTMKTLQQIYDQQDAIHQLVEAFVSPQTLSDTTTVVNTGYYQATDLTVVDPDFTPTNIRYAVVLFGVTGTVRRAEGDAVAGDVLSGRTFSREGAVNVTGTMANQGARGFMPGVADVTIPAGYYSGAGMVTGDAALVTGNIRSGTAIFGVAGKTEVVDTAGATATDGDILSGKTAYADGVQRTGSMATRTLADTTTVVRAGYYVATNLVEVDADLAAANIKAGTAVFGVDGSAIEATGDATVAQVLSGATFSKAGAAGLTGTMANQGARGFMPGVADVTIPAGYYSGTGVVTGDAALVTGNIKKDVTIFGVTGTMYNAAVPKTGQTTSYAAGDDGDLEKGVAWPSQRFTDNANGTVTDNLTGLIWLKNANFKEGKRTWAQALTDCATLNSGEGGLSDGSVEGDWRLPNKRELQSLIDLGRSSPALPSGHLFTGVQSDYYWSSSTHADSTGLAWFVRVYDGYVGYGPKTVTYYVWPVRGGQ